MILPSASGLTPRQIKDDHSARQKVAVLILNRCRQRKGIIVVCHFWRAAINLQGRLTGTEIRLEFHRNRLLSIIH